MATGMIGSSILKGDNTIPGVKLPKELKKIIPEIDRVCKEFGLSYNKFIVQMLTYDEISEIAAYGGFAVRYPHWQWGMEYEELYRGYEHGKHRIYEMIINCVELTTQILTNRGTINASDVVEGDTVFADGPREVVKVVKQAKSATKRIKIKGYVKDLICTPNHKWKVITPEGLIWKESKDIVSGDLLVGADSFGAFLGKPCKINWSKDKVHEKTRPNIRHCLQDISPPKEMTLELAELLGILVGNGNIDTDNINQLNVSINHKVPDYAEHVKKLFESVFNKNAVVYDKPSCYVVGLCSKYAVDFVDSLGCNKGVVHKNKKIPVAIWQSSQEYRAAFLRGLFDTDGSVAGGLGFSTTSCQLISDVQLMLAEMGIASKVEMDVPNGFGKNGDQKFINILDIVSKPNTEKFSHRINFMVEYKRKGLEEINNKSYCRGGGLNIPLLRNKIVSWGQKQGFTSYNVPTLGWSLLRMQKSDLGFNDLYSFIERALNLGYAVDEDILELANTPIFVVDSIEDNATIETIDIALKHEKHDFIANGLLSHNTNPVYMYCLDSNTYVDNVTVVAHALGHAHFFKNNKFFEPTNQNGEHQTNHFNIMNELASHGTRIRKYMSRWGKQTVGEFIDHILSIDELVDPVKMWKRRIYKEPELTDHREYEERAKLQVKHEYMNDWINPPEEMKKEDERIRTKELMKLLNVLEKPEKDILGFLMKHAPLTTWQRDVVAMLHEEACYFHPQRGTKVINEGFASYVDYNIMARIGLAGNEGIFDYALHKAGVLGGKYSMNPYNLGFKLLLEIEERWDKGRFGKEYEECKNIRDREKWDKKLGLGRAKVFDVVAEYNDVLLINEFFDQDFCDKYEFYLWKHFPNGEYKIESRDAKLIKKHLVQSRINGGMPDIKLVDYNHKGKGVFLMQHSWDGRPLLPKDTSKTLESVAYLWKNPVALATRNSDGEEIVYSAVPSTKYSEAQINVMSREEYENLVNV